MAQPTRFQRCVFRNKKNSSALFGDGRKKERNVSNKYHITTDYFIMDKRLSWQEESSLYKPYQTDYHFTAPFLPSGNE